MGRMGYNKIGRKCHGMRGFKLNIRKFSVQKLRAKFLFMFRFFSCCRSSVQCLKRNIGRRKCKEDSSNMNNLVMAKVVPYRHVTNSRLKSFARSNSFYSEAIADCLDFIKRNSISLEEKPVLQR